MKISGSTKSKQTNKNEKKNLKDLTITFQVKRNYLKPTFQLEYTIHDKSMVFVELHRHNHCQPLMISF